MSQIKSIDCNIAEERKKGANALWNQPDCTDALFFILDSREPFKKGQLALVTSMGFVAVGSLFNQTATTQECYNKHFEEVSGKLTFDPERKLLISIKNGTVVKLAMGDSNPTAPAAKRKFATKEEIKAAGLEPDNFSKQGDGTYLED